MKILSISLSAVFLLILFNLAAPVTKNGNGQPGNTEVTAVTAYGDPNQVYVTTRGQAL